MAGILGYLSILTDDISALAGKTMASASKSLATSLDDIPLLFDDIVTYTKLAGVKSSGLIIDDLAAISSFTNDTTSDILKKELNNAKSLKELESNIKKLDDNEKKEVLKELEEIKKEAILQAQKNAAKRELPIVYKIAKGSFKNKFIIIPIVLLASSIAPWLIAPALIIGGFYLSYEGVETIIEKLFHHDNAENKHEKSDNKLSAEEFENQKVSSAVKTDFILSFEIIVITLSLLENTSFIAKVSVLILIGIITTVGVYGIVALIIKLDDIGFYLQEKKSSLNRTIGNLLVKSMPIIIKIISIIGTVAMLAVGGGIVAHTTHMLSFLDTYMEQLGSFSSLGIFLSEIILGIILGLITVVVLPYLVKITTLFKRNKS